jgi:hypothetical protein
MQPSLQRPLSMAMLPHQSIDPAFPVINWRGATGAFYSLNLHEIGTVFFSVGGVYIFCRGLNAAKWQAIYTGESDNLLRSLTNELASHPQWESARRYGFTHISSCRVDNTAERRRIETDLRHGLNPPCNLQWTVNA